nr:hypothetical protein [Tanacetum cinerariifolium]
MPDTEDIIIFKLDSQEIVYTVDMFHNTLQLPVESLENPFVVPANIEIIESFMNKVSYQGVVDKTKINILQLFHVMVNRTYMDYAALLWIEEDYHSVKDDILLVSVYTTRNVTVRGMLILDAFLTKENRATDDFKEYETVFINPGEGEKVEQSYDDFDDSDSRLEPGSHKENPDYVDDDDDKEEEKADEKEGNLMGSLEIRNEKIQTPVPTTPISPRSPRIP